MPVFDVGGVSLEVPEAELDAGVREALASGRYEHAEANALLVHLAAGDRVLDLGAGCGFLTVVAAAVVGPDAVVAVEPNPAMPAVIAANVARNGLSPVTVIHGAAVPGTGGGTVFLHLRSGFWAASTLDTGHGRKAPVDVPALGLQGLFEIARPTVLMADLEGAEATLFDEPLPQDVRLAVVELHPAQYGQAGIAAVFGAFARSGFTYCPRGSRGRTVVFERAGAG
ncbi:FkbM family methyltransferase [Palleronia sp. KMU-117]|uniref:FkbM family methyltransferase n=1 Tax=Palleronia sp. KMU-117 TaxID=3434108 RepID=UPI003D74CAAD